MTAAHSKLAEKFLAFHAFIFSCCCSDMRIMSDHTVPPKTRKRKKSFLRRPHVIYPSRIYWSSSFWDHSTYWFTSATFSPRNGNSCPCTKRTLSHPSNLSTHLSGCGPNVLEVSITLSQSVHGIVRLSHSTNESAKSVDLVLASVSAVLVNLSDGDLDGSVVLGLDDAVCGAALAGDVAI